MTVLKQISRFVFKIKHGFREIGKKFSREFYFADLDFPETHFSQIWISVGLLGIIFCGGFALRLCWKQITIL